MRVEFSDEDYSQVTEKNPGDPRDASFTHEKKPLSDRQSQPIVIDERKEVVRQSQETDGGQNPYSDFDEDDDAAAVGSGIVETNENYDEDYEEMDDNYKEAYEAASDSAGSTSLKVENPSKP